MRLTFLYFNYSEFDKLKAVYEALDKLLRQGVFYSRRILFNYYANSVMLHSKFDVLQQAEEFGYLSIKQKNTDHLHYLNNYSAILLRQGKIHEALALMKQSFSSLRSTNNLRNKIGFMAFYIKCLNLNGQPADGEKMADSFLRDNAKEVLAHRWHIFFVAYFQALVLQEKYDKLLRACHKFHLLPKEAEFSKDPRRTVGTTVALVLGNQSVFSGRFCHAQVLSPKLAFKVTGEYTQGEDFPHTDTVYYTNTTFRRTATLTTPASAGKFHAATEFGLDRTFKSLHGEAALYYSLTDKADVIVSYGGNPSSFLAQTNAGRNQIKDWTVQYLHARYVSPHIFAQVHNTWSQTDDTYAINQRTKKYLSFKDAGFGEEEARRRSFSEQWFGTTTTAGTALKRGAVFRDASRRLNGEVQYNNTFGIFNLVVGTQYQRDMANSRNTYLFDRDGDIINQIGVYGHGELTLPAHFKLIAAARADQHDRYGFNFIPKAAVVWSHNDQSLRLTYGQGIAAPTILNLDGYLFGGLLIGNAEGFTLGDGTVINKLKVETIKTWEVGYKGKVTPKFFVDANAYYNRSKDFLSPAINIATNGRRVTKRGNTRITEVVPGTPEAGAAALLTYVNFSQVDTYGADLGLTYYLSNTLSLALNYSRFGFGFNLDTDDLNNDGNKDGNKDGKVQKEVDLPINTPANKGSLAVNYSGKKLFGSVFTRYVQAYDFYSGINVAAAANPTLGVRENARFGRTWNYGPLGGFTTVDVSAGYRVNSYLTASAQVVNLFDTKMREFVASPFIGRLYSVELKVNLPAVGTK
ncbi:TonB-dependent receptor plug domain-containing protein [Hymenobacter sp. B1770]|uniref:TonB-dependent receptor plug domain-containing protein n=1 Tax=Hymenobacter sp. B1770 TaxID=1718788 RepID=UPI003CF2A362